MRIKIWGARGSLPAPLAPADVESRIRSLFSGFFDAGFTTPAQVDSYLRGVPVHQLSGFGGNTPCIEIKSATQQVIIDGGSGLRALGAEMMNGPCGKGMGEVHLAFTHFHWDHLIGLPFFAPIFLKGNRIHVYSVQPDLKQVFQTVFKKPYFPVPLEKLGARIEYHQVEPRKPFSIGDVQLTPYLLDHPDPCWGYRVESGGRAYAHCVDTECTRFSEDELGDDRPLYQNADLMIFDAQYTLKEHIEKVDWGHASAALGLDLAIREGIKRVIFMHHDPSGGDEKVAEAEAQARHYFQNLVKDARRSGATIPHVQWEFAVEGMEIQL